MDNSPELTYVLLIFTLLVVPHFFHRFKIPSAIIAFLLGVGATTTQFLQLDGTISILSTIGISALFLFAGMEVDFSSVKKNSKLLIQHIMGWVALLTLIGFAINYVFGLEVRAAAIVSLALLTPSTGFIIESLETSTLELEHKSLVKSIAIGTEIIALLIMFVVLQSDSGTKLSLSILAMGAIIALVPLLFVLFAKTVIPHAPNADFAFFLMLAVVAGFLTKKIGAYYLIGAFIVGVAARRFENLFSNRDTEETVRALRLFSTFFIPFYFFKAGISVQLTNFTWMSLATGLGFFIILTPIRLSFLMGHGYISFKQTYHQLKSVALSLLPTLVFGLVLVEILSRKFTVEQYLVDGLIIYTILASIVPRFFIKPSNVLV